MSQPPEEPTPPDVDPEHRAESRAGMDRAEQRPSEQDPPRVAVESDRDWDGRSATDRSAAITEADRTQVVPGCAAAKRSRPERARRRWKLSRRARRACAWVVIYLLPLALSAVQAYGQLRGGA